MPRASQNNHASSRSVSRDPEIEKEFLPTPRVPKTNWRQIAEDDNVSHIVDYIREEIFRSATDTIYQGYLRRAVYSFVTNCVYEAWMRAFRWVHLEYDNREISLSMSDSQISDKTLDEKDLRLRRGVPTPPRAHRPSRFSHPLSDAMGPRYFGSLIKRKGPCLLLWKSISSSLALSISFPSVRLLFRSYFIDNSALSPKITRKSFLRTSWVAQCNLVTIYDEQICRHGNTTLIVVVAVVAIVVVVVVITIFRKSPAKYPCEWHSTG